MTILIIGLIYDALNLRANDLRIKKLSSMFFIVPSFILLFVISAFRGNFTSDYKNYTRLFHEYNAYGFLDVFNAGFGQEPGYIFLSRLIGEFTNNEVYLFIITTLIILIGYFWHIKKYSVNIWLSVLLFVTIDRYYTSFNITRQIVAVAIVFAGSKFLYDRKFLKFFLVVALASLFHKASLIMIPFYFILNFRIRIRNLILFFAGSVILVIFFENIVSIAQNFGIYDNYTEQAYGMTGASFANVALPIALAIFSLFHSKKLDSINNNMHRIWFNATIFYAIFSLLTLKILMVERISFFFSPYIILLIPYLFSKMNNKYLRLIYIMVLTGVLILYNYLVYSESVYDPYYFFWDN